MKITRLTPNDYEHFYSLRLASLEECPEEFATDAEAWKNAPRETINKLLVNSEERQDTPIFGAWKNDDLVGLVGVNRDLRPSVMHKSTLWGLYIKPDQRKQGCGGALLNEVIMAAQKIPDLRLIRAVVTVTSKDALSLLEKHGFKVFGQEPEAKRLNDKYYDQVYLWLPLREQ
jgi:ribosomal protein S18 acetylase RimI-like enzyme